MESKVVPLHEFLASMYRNKDKVYYLELDGWMVPVLHAVVALSADRLGAPALGQPTKQVIDTVRSWCLEIFKEWGYTPPQVHYLDQGKHLFEKEGGDGKQ